MEKILIMGNNPAFLINEEEKTVKKLKIQPTNIDWIYISPIDTEVEYMHNDKLVTVPVKKGQIIIQFYQYSQYGENYSQITVLDGENTTWINNMNIINDDNEKKCECTRCSCCDNSVPSEPEQVENA